MIVSSIKLEFSDASWALPSRPGESVRRIFDRVVGRDEVRDMENAVERMSLAELLYYVLLGEGAGA